MVLKRVLSVLVAISIVLPSAANTAPDKVFAKENSPAGMISDMTVEEKLEQMILISLPRAVDPANGGLGMTELSEQYKNVFQKHGLCGVILYRDNLPETEQGIRLIDDIQKANATDSKRPSLFVAADHEGGRVWRLPSGAKFSGNMALGATGDISNSALAGRIMGSEMAKMGFNADFAPVLDVNSNPSNPIIGTRSFSDDPMTVANHGVAMMQGLQSGEGQNPGGVITALKHFPGHGDTSVDSHTGLPVIYRNYEQLKKNELIPFKACIDAGADMIMTAHISFPNIEPNSYASIKDGQSISLPASLSQVILTGILRNDMGYKGVIITDALNMGAIRENFLPADAASLAINAGADILLDPVIDSAANLDGLIAELSDRVKDGRIDAKKVDDAVLRILKLKEKKGLINGYGASGAKKRTEGAEGYIGQKANKDAEWEIAKKSITLVKNKKHALPLNGGQRTAILVPEDEMWQSVQDGIERARQEGVLSAGSAISVTSYSDLSAAQMKQRVKGAKNVMIFTLAGTISALRAVDANGEPTPTGKVDELVKALSNKKNVHTTVACYGLPYEAARYPKADAVMLCWNSTGVPAATYLAFLKDGNTGQGSVTPATTSSDGSISTMDLRITGTLPVNIPRIKNDYSFGKIKYKRGFGLSYSGNLSSVRRKNTSVIPSIKTVRLSPKNYTYDGKTKKPEVVVKDRNGNALSQGTDYEVSYTKGRKAVGEYSVKVDFKGRYGGSETLTYQIRPTKTKIKKLEGEYKGFSVSWEKRPKQASGYQIQYGIPKNFQKNSKIATVKSSKAGGKEISDLKSKTVYYARVRVFKELSDGRKIVSPWSSLTKVKTY